MFVEKGSEEDRKVRFLCDVTVPDKFYNRIRTGYTLLDLAFGGEVMPGILPGSSWLFTGGPGAGKSTMALQLAAAVTETDGRRALYNVGEEVWEMVKMAANRMGLGGRHLPLGKFREVDELVDYCVREDVEFLVQDSIQSMSDHEMTGDRLLRSVVKKLVDLSKSHDVTVFCIGHITKSGEFAGAQWIKHLVDAHAHLNIDVDSGNRVFELHKNRFGPTGIPYEFFLTAEGLNFQEAKVREPDRGEAAAGGTSKSQDKKIATKAEIKRLLVAGIGVDGYKFAEYDGTALECAGGFWRMMLETAAKELRGEGNAVVARKVDGRTTYFLEA